MKFMEAAVSYQMPENNCGTYWNSTAVTDKDFTWNAAIIFCSKVDRVCRPKQGKRQPTQYIQPKTNWPVPNCQDCRKKKLETCLLFVHTCYRHDSSQTKRSWGKFTSESIDYIHVQACTHTHARFPPTPNKSYIPSFSSSDKYIYIYTHTRARAHTNTKIHKYLYIFICVCVCVYVWRNMCKYVCARMNAYIPNIFKCVPSYANF